MSLKQLNLIINLHLWVHLTKSEILIKITLLDLSPFNDSVSLISESLQFDPYASESHSAENRTKVHVR